MKSSLLWREQVFASRADLKIDTDFDRAHVDHAIDRTLEATLKDMATTNAYVMVRQPDSHPRLKPVLDLFQTDVTAIYAQFGRVGALYGRPSGHWRALPRPDALSLHLLAQ